VSLSSKTREMRDASVIEWFMIAANCVEVCAAEIHLYEECYGIDPNSFGVVDFYGDGDGQYGYDLGTYYANPVNSSSNMGFGYGDMKLRPIS
jgi:hypothetical protein